MGATARILVVDDEPSLRQLMDVGLRRVGYDVRLASSVAEALDALEAATPPFDLVITDLMLGDGVGTQVLDRARELSADTQVIMVTAHGSVEIAVDAIRRGAYTFLEKPVSIATARAQVEKALEKRSILKDNAALRTLTRALTPEGAKGALIGNSPAFRAAMEFVRRAAPTRASVLITGESGTGKELFARRIHEASERSGGPFVVVNCGAIPETLMESELFGHEKGVYTGADKARPGLFREAEGGTIFLDEVGELPLQLQVKLLRALQEKKIRPLGLTAEVAVDVRVVAATNRDLQVMVREKKFREDLYYRLNVLSIKLPPLRERREDLPHLLTHFQSRFGHELGRPLLSFDTAAMRCLLDYDWPGNVREFENVIERAMTLAQGSACTLDDLPAEVVGRAAPQPGVIALPPEGINLEETLEGIERSLIRQALDRTRGVRTRAAGLLGLTFRSLRYRLQKLGMAAEAGGADDGDDADA